MEIDDPLQSNIESVRKKSETLKTLTTAPKNPISSSISKLSSSSRVLPTEKDFHFYYNFNEFKSPIDEIAAKSQSMLRQIGSAKGLWGGKEIPFVDDVEEESYDWVVNVNDEVVERFDVSCDEFSTLRKAEENAARGAGKLVDESGFELVCGKKMKAALLKGDVGESVAGGAGVRVVERDRKTGGARPKLPFHIPTIRKPQDEFNIIVNNANQPFQHVWLERSEDGSRFIHPLEKLSASDFVDTNIEVLEPMKPPALEDTPFKMVEDVKDLKELAAKLRGVNEFAVDLEHNQYRSFQGLTCLMQISTRTEDFVVDTLKLKIHVGPYLREVFKDPTKKKVMHGADRDIEWLQRDFGIYVCNLFDTGQASRVLQMERYSLEHLLQHFCGVSANKEYQNADWRLRPLPLEMLRYAREDTHYLLYIFDLMRVRLVSESTDPENSNALLLEVYQRSYDLCSRLYEKELLTDTSYLYIYGVQAANLNAQQLSVVAGLSAWRDGIARREDESTGYVLPNKLLLEIAKQMPLTTNQLKRLIKSKHPHVERNLGSVISVIRLSVQNASSFEAVAEQLKEGRIQVAPDLTFGEDDFPELQTAGDNSEGYDGSQHEVPSPLQSKEEGYKFAAHNFELTSNGVGVAYKGGGQNGNMRNDTTYGIISKSQSDQLAFPSQKSEINASTIYSGKVAEATVQVLKKPGRAFGALLGNPASKKKVDLKKEDDKLQQIKSSVNLPFYSFSHKDQETENLPKQVLKEQNRSSDTLHSREYPFESASSSKSEDIILLDGDQHSDQVPEEPNIISGGRQAEPASSTKLDDVILLDSDSNDDEEPDGSLAGDENHKNTTDHQVASEPELVVLDEDEDDGNEPVSLSDLSSSFQKCLQSANEDQTCKQVGSIPLQFTPFDYEAARKQIEFGEDAEKRLKTGDDEEKKLGKKKVVTGRSKQDEAVLPQGKRRQAFPTSGNRSATFR